MSTRYEFITNAPLEERQSYTYTQYFGQPFLNEWRWSRHRVIEHSLSQASSSSFRNEVESVGEFKAGGFVNSKACLEQLLSAPPKREHWKWLDFFIQRFEVSKRLFDEYTLTASRPKSIGNYTDLELYLLFAELLIRRVSLDLYFPAVNALLKVVDTLLGLESKLSQSQRSRLVTIVSSEFEVVKRIADRNVVSSNPLLENSQPVTVRKSPQKFDMSHTTFIAADTVRTRAYALALKQVGYRFDSIIFLKSTKPKWGQASDLPAFTKSLECGVFSADLNVNLEQLLNRISDNVTEVTTDTVNCIDVKNLISELSSTFIVFSGYGGEIVDVRGLAPTTPMLHIHSGYLPHFRGSTTVYYSILEDNSCGASAIILEPAIDEGVILNKKKFRLPVVTEEIDYYYDSFIRADVLVGTLKELIDGAGQIEVEQQHPEHGVSYYIIHPVLKHLSIMKVNGITPTLATF
ncbi:MAG: hypothetical protein LAT77_10595 [Aliidiomarina sp.]|uniref:hypothetical protein n=1 Tax=Aliidiomarina sp. TaxID=1872439 RepID=UPI0025BC6819|nr:hypothetical protein [Aliidiomarina sp.]MCH8502343.1 hypothetical protein [Aliidiomarina sp.]